MAEALSIQFLNSPASFKFHLTTPKVHYTTNIVNEKTKRAHTSTLA